MREGRSEKAEGRRHKAEGKRIKMRKDYRDKMLRGANDVFIRGVIAGLKMYAFWKDGVQYVGNCGTTLKEAIEEIKKGRPKK